MSSPTEAFALLVLPNVSLTQANTTESGVLALECVTVPHPGASTGSERDVYLVLRINATETPLDPDRIVQRIDGPSVRIYNFHGSQADPTEITLTFHLSPANPQGYLEDLDTFEGILAQYHTELRGANYAPPTSATTPSAKEKEAFGPTSMTPVQPTGQSSRGNGDLRGHLVMIDENTGEVVGQVEDRFRIQEDPIMYTKGHENDPVVIEVGEESGAESDANALEAFARIVPPDQQNWITKGATVVSHAMSMTTNLVVTTITSASNYYINHSTPSPHRSAPGSPNPGSPVPPGTPGSPPPVPPRPKALVFLTSETTRKNLGKVHAVSGEAVKVSAKTVGYIDNMIRRAIGSGPKRDKKAFLRAGNQITPVSSQSSVGSSGSSSGLAPPPYTAPGAPPLHPRQGSASPAPPPLPPRENKPLSTKDKILLSADLLLSTIDHSTRQLIDTGSTQLSRVVTHKYGEEAGQSTTLLTGTARNVGLVYVDMRGIGRRALLKRVGKTYVKSKLSSNKDPAGAAQATPAGTPAVPYKD